MRKTQPTYQDNVFGYILKMKPNEPVELSKIVSPENRQKFMEVVKDFIRYDFGKTYGFYIEFSSDYKSFRKKGC